MTRKKKKTGGNGDLVYARKVNRKVADIEGRLRKKDKKRKGLQAGARHAMLEETAQQTQHQKRDPRLGSKKKIPLVVEAAKLTPEKKRLTAEQELEMLENDAQLQVLIQRLDAGEKLGAGLQQYVDERLERMEKLMKQLGLYEDVDDAEDDVQFRSTGQDSQDLLDAFDQIDIDDFNR